MKTAATILCVSLAIFPHLLSLGCTPPVQGVTVYKPEKCDNGYTLLSSIGSHENPPGSGVYHGALLIDMEGSLVHEWAMSGMPAKMLPGGHVMGYRSPRDDGTGHLEWDALVVMDWHGREVWSWEGWDVDAHGNPISRGHHDFQREGSPGGCPASGMDGPVRSGRTLLVVHENLEKPEIAPWTLEDDVILEVDREGRILWEWHASDHFDEFGFAEDAREALRTVQVIMPEVLGGGADVTDWLHVNSVSLLGPNRWWQAGDSRFHPENIIVSSRSANILWIIEKATGDIVWKVGPDYSRGRPEARLGQIIGQHNAQMIPKGLPGAGNILVFDNGGAAGFGMLFGRPAYPNKIRVYSRVIEFAPVSFEVVWEYQRRAPGDGERFRFYSYYVSGAQRLGNGNTLITEGATGRVFEVTAAGELVWEYISPYHDFPADLVPPSNPLHWENDLYRAYRISYGKVPRELLP